MKAMMIAVIIMVMAVMNFEVTDEKIMKEIAVIVVINTTSGKGDIFDMTVFHFFYNMCDVIRFFLKCLIALIMK